MRFVVESELKVKVLPVSDSPEDYSSTAFAIPLPDGGQSLWREGDPTPTVIHAATAPMPQPAESSQAAAPIAAEPVESEPAQEPDHADIQPSYPEGQRGADESGCPATLAEPAEPYLAETAVTEPYSAPAGGSAKRQLDEQGYISE